MRLGPVRVLALLALSLAACGLATDPSDMTGPEDGKDDGGGSSANARFLPAAEWSGRLILPTPAERRGSDGVWLEVENAPIKHAKLIGQRVWLKWRDTAENADRLARTVVDVQFDQRAKDSQAKGNVHPTRLDGWRDVGPLESLAGARPTDDVRVALAAPKLTGAGRQVVLEIDDEPTMIEGRRRALVTVVREVSRKDTELTLRVRHYSRKSAAFTGREEDMVFPRAKAKDAERAPMTSVDDLAKSPLNGDGWTVYGDFGADTRFRVEALEPRALFRLQPDRAVGGVAAALAYLGQDNWKDPTAQKGRASRVVVEPSAPAATSTPAGPLVARWHEGDRLLLIHLFGTVTRQPGETVGPLRPGHFSFGTATIAKDPFTDEPRLVVSYRQVYAHNGEAVLAGSHSFASYMGSLRRGWMFLRPISDVLLRFDAVAQPYDFAGLQVDAHAGLVHELEIMTARYRTGNGTGAALVTPATSCVQDSAHALFLALVRFDEEVQTNPTVKAWLAAHPDDPQSKRFAGLSELIDWLASFLSPVGIDRADWRASLDTLAAKDACPGALIGQLACGLTSYNTMFPRHAHDRLIQAMLERGASAWFLRTNQIGGVISGFDPLAPTSPTIP